MKNIPLSAILPAYTLSQRALRFCALFSLQLKQKYLSLLFAVLSKFEPLFKKAFSKTDKKYLPFLTDQTQQPASWSILSFALGPLPQLLLPLLALRGNLQTTHSLQVFSAAEFSYCEDPDTVAFF